MNSIYFKNFMAMAVIVLTSFLIVGVSFVFILRYFVMNDARENMVANAEQISRNASRFPKPTSPLSTATVSWSS